MNPLGIALFALTYALISARRLGWLGLDRPAGALLGAVLFVVFGVLGPSEAIDAIDGSTLLLLFAVMGTGAFLSVDGFFDGAERLLVARVRTPAALLGAVVWGAGLLAALITNDAVCVLGTPLVVRLTQRTGLPPLPYLLALATGANTGSVATLVGNPQNMLCARLGGLAYLDHLQLLLPVALVGLAINHGVVWLLFRSELGRAELLSREPKPSATGALGEAPAQAVNRRSQVTLGVIAVTVIAYGLGADLAWAAAAALVTLMLLHRRDTQMIWSRIDWSLLVFFAGLFVAVQGFVVSGGPSFLFSHFALSDLMGSGDGAGWARVSAFFLFGSNVVSNVPFILVVRDQMEQLPDARLGWEILAMASTFAGNLTLLGSAANIIVADGAREVGGFSFFSYLRVGAPVALLTTAFGVAYLLLAT